MKLKSLVLSGFLLATTYANAAIYIVSNVGTGNNKDRLFQNAGSATSGLVDGGIVAIGYFADGVPSSSLTEIQRTISAFTSQATGILGGRSEDLGGSFAGYVQSPAFIGTVIPLGNSLIGKAVYAFAGNGSTLATSTAWALIQVASVAADEPNVQTYTATIPDSAPLIGRVGTFTGVVNAASATYSTLQLQAVPEPTTALLCGLGLIGFLRRKRN